MPGQRPATARSERRYRHLPDFSSWQIVLQKSPSGLCEIEICNYRIGAPVLLNRYCVLQPDLESLFPAEMLKILLQHNRGNSRRDLLTLSSSLRDPKATLLLCYSTRLANGFATSRAYSMKSCATGLSIRFFRVTTPNATRATDSLTGKTLISGRGRGNLNIEVG